MRQSTETRTVAERGVDYAFSGPEKEGLYKAIFSRRDVRSHFVRNKDIPDDALLRILNAAHHAPSVGFSQPWNFILIKDAQTRKRVKESFERERERSIKMLENDKEKQERYARLKLEGIMESALNICVTYDPTRFGPFVLGRTSIEDTGVYSVCCAIQNLWLAARAEGVGVGWVSILSNEDLERILGIPAHVKPVAYLCLGYVEEFAQKPDLERAGWLPRMDLAKVICYEKWGKQESEKWSGLCDAVSRLSRNNI
ncbi:cob(II)yrinic acid a,c-diamide reductase [Candidatus Nitrososphaera evergladensis SR1]|uniref:Cob(II)yrinic acid a,c-diamide reductase n=1 Tax=Candidatus Nitrososphaera evergladensis SR1 TaxID=1459636 RepID=A0A075MP21_9ARCH|nr:cob(II)yrinic acid a,c-diamide reductase [Candidatus Nitrososphaera evergladensis SR1]